MPRRKIDLIAAGPPSGDPSDPAASGWALAHGLARRGHDVQVVYPGPADGPTEVDGLPAVPYPALTTHLGSVRGDAELAKLAGHHLRSSPDAVVRDPYAGGAIGHAAHGRPIVAFVRSIGEGAGPASAPAHGRGVGRLGGAVARWGERRDTRRLEREGLHEASRILCATPALRETLQREYGVPPEKIRLTHGAIAQGPPPPDRAAARRAVGVPDDVPLVATFVPASGPTPELPPAMQQVFARLRVIFVGCRLVAVGLPSSSIAGAVALPSRDAATLGTVTAASDAAVVFDPGPAAIPAAVFALRAGVPLVGSPALHVGDASEEVVHTANIDDPGELASVLAELLADRGGRTAHEATARRLAEQYDPETLADELERTGALGRA